MILAFLGGLLFVIGACTGSVAAAVIGAVLVFCGILAIDEHDERMKARRNRQRFWAYGEEPDWMRNEKNIGRRM